VSRDGVLICLMCMLVFFSGFLSVPSAAVYV
jgi:hypothetical protein